MSERLRVGISTLISVLLHVLLLFGIGFEVSRMLKHASPPLEIILVNSKTAHKPVKADALAQANLAGGGNIAEKRRAKSPLPPVDTKEVRSDEVEAKQEQLSQLERESKHLLAAIKDSETVQSDKKIADTHDLAQKSLEIARIEAQIDNDMDAYQKIPKETDVSPSTREYRFARYVEDWRIKVERIGSLNFPEEAKRRQIFGSLLLNVCIRPDGSLDRVEIVRPSGHRILDDAAIRIARLAAPYAPLPKDIRKDTDILCIYRTWMFTRSNEMVSK
ncbi:MAG: TonB family protein [Burkholderiales bacterium]